MSDRIPKIKIIDKSLMLRGEKEEKPIGGVGQTERYDKCEINKVPVRFLSSDMVIYEEITPCERMKKGMLNNCSICQNINNEIFIRCKTKFR